MADDRLAPSRASSMLCSSAGNPIFFNVAIWRSDSQNSSSSETLVLCPFNSIDRLMIADFYSSTARPLFARKSDATGAAMVALVLWLVIDLPRFGRSFI